MLLDLRRIILPVRPASYQQRPHPAGSRRPAAGNHQRARRQELDRGYFDYACHALHSSLSCRESKRSANAPKPSSNYEFPAMNSTATDLPTPPDTRPAAKCNLLEYVEKNPVASVIQALAAGFAVGMIIRMLDGSRAKEPGIDLKHKPTLDDAKFHLGSLLLPFLWPAWMKAREGYGKSADKVRDAIGKVNKEKLTREGRERLRQAEAWAEELAELGKKKAKDIEAWAEQEAEHLTEAGKKKVEEWVEKEILPAAECGWKKLRKFLG
jgi:hypothetical protein